MQREDVERLARLLDALSGDCAHTDGWEDGGATCTEAAAALRALLAERDAAIAAAPQPAPDREALGEWLDREFSAWNETSFDTPLTDYLADALLARGLRLPGGEETMAWAVVGEDGALTAINYDRRTARHLCGSGECIIRVAIRVVEGGDDA